MLWSTNVGDSDPSMTLVGRVLVVAGGGCGQESGLDRTTGALLWSENTNACFGGSQPVSSTNGIYLWAAADFGSPLVYDPASGAVLGEFSTDTPAFGYGEAVGVTNPGSATPGQLRHRPRLASRPVVERDRRRFVLHDAGTRRRIRV